MNVLEQGQSIIGQLLVNSWSIIGVLDQGWGSHIFCGQLWIFGPRMVNYWSIVGQLLMSWPGMGQPQLLWWVIDVFQLLCFVYQVPVLDWLLWVPSHWPCGDGWIQAVCGDRITDIQTHGSHHRLRQPQTVLGWWKSHRVFWHGWVSQTQRLVNTSVVWVFFCFWCFPCYVWLWENFPLKPFYNLFKNESFPFINILKSAFHFCSLLWILIAFKCAVLCVCGKNVK